MLTRTIIVNPYFERLVGYLLRYPVKLFIVQHIYVEEHHFTRSNIEIILHNSVNFSF